MHFIQNRTIKYEDVGERLYFDPKDFKTEAFYNVVKHSEPSIIKELRVQLKDLFLTTGASEILMTTKDLKMEFGIRFEYNYINKEIQNYLKVDRLKDNNGNDKVTTYTYFKNDILNPDKLIEVKGKGRPFVFKREQFVTNKNQ